MQDEPIERVSPGMVLVIALCIMIGAVVITATIVTAGIGGLIVAALVIIFVGVPLAIRKVRRPVDNPASVEEEEQRERFAPETTRERDHVAPPHP